MKTIIIALVSIIISTTAFSQIGVKAGFALGEPVNDDYSNMHLGFDVGLTYDITESFRAEVLFEGLFRKESSLFLGDFKSRIMPLTIGADYRFFTGMIQPFIGFNLGIVTIGSSALNYSNSETYFGLHPKAGVNIKLTDNILIDATIKYHVVFNNSSGNNSNVQILAANFGLIYVFN